LRNDFVKLGLRVAGNDEAGELRPSIALEAAAAAAAGGDTLNEAIGFDSTINSKLQRGTPFIFAKIEGVATHAYMSCAGDSCQCMIINMSALTRMCIRKRDIARF
jgi:hypothetical protein